ncbi:peptide/nickel transport system ATP-binding protein/peptide/nickel transport system ATP-binding protein [Haloactinopolyspora alba]|uniref:Peptide/nickel transport system ATP-binding protein/peptide/nickel transport system ATP-binding protein n=1 Tax=Haloactinopolyspora alba TaxID=648780 RepID=A0A2P8E7P4_9ACTN|nr:ABC transporter ATP-binding protein [Haloactinopolyspora alba]PSL05481.1 peptide/nickel transport system ATP-binding protein/peptide/nickel transport system ATP-binding protein [Haloactinopolyspora alba]
MSLLEVENLNVTFPTPDGMLHAVRDVSFTVQSGQTLGIVGESGSGKSVLMQTVMGLTHGARITGQAYFEGQDLLTMTEAERRGIRGARIGMIFQDPLTSLHPHYRVGWQIVEMIRAHGRQTSKRAARARAIELLDHVGIPQPDQRVDAFPHELSGGMRQRVMIAMAMALEPALLIADEPTTALDVTVQAQILELVKWLKDEIGSAVVMITHDLGVVAEMADTIMVMYAGGPVEWAQRRTIYYAPHHPYTRGLLSSLPAGERRSRLDSITGQPPSLITLPSGCPFHPRCPFVMDRCITERPPLRQVAGGNGDGSHRSACWLPIDAVGLGEHVDEQRAAYAHDARGATVHGRFGDAP